MVSTPVQNLSDFLKNRPPLVVFLICLVGLAVSTFYFAFEIEKDGPTVNTDKQHDWTRMLKHFNKLEICVNKSTCNNGIKNIEEQANLKDEISVLTRVNIDNINILQSFSRVYGFLSLEGWYSTACQKPEKQPPFVNIEFEIPSIPPTELNNSIDVCVIIRGPAQFLPYLKHPLCRPTKKPENSKPVTGCLVSKNPRMTDPKFCEKGTLTKLTFDLTEPEIENYLSDDVRTQIYIHLMWCSYFLVFVIFGILLYSIVKKSDYLEKKEQNARIL